MKKSVIISLIGIIILGSGIPVSAQDNGYKATPVTISKEKVKQNGKVYWSHVVLEKQTLFSISKAYNVSIQDIYDANPALNLETEGLKTYQILLIPVVDGVKQENTVEEASKTDIAPEIKGEDVKPAAAPAEGDYMIYTVKWFDDLNSIAKKYGVSKEAIMKANGLKSEALSRKQKLKIPLGAEPVQENGVAEEEEKEKSIFETISEAISEKAEELFYSEKKDIAAALILPFNAQKQPNENNLDFYSGVLLAAKDLAVEGVNVDLSVYDAAGGIIPVTGEEFGGKDLVLGPISTADIASTLKICGSHTPVISPLEPKAAEMAASYANLIQAPSSSEAQCNDLIEWLKEEYRTGDRIILFTEKGASRTAGANELLNALSNSGLTYSTVTYGLLEGKNIAGTIENGASPEHTVRVVVASESEAFVSDVVRNANLVAHRKFNVALYCTSKIRSFETIEVENLHNTNLHTSISYYVDYDSPDVQRFLMQYRALFNTEPGPFAFQGYDTASYFCRLASKYGSHWMNKVEDTYGKGLQSDFSFKQSSGEGYVNTAVRRVLYGPDFRVTMLSGK
ncbi:MAG: LysM peptidoglycan-binding domain-containing protein [Bacteroidia bacterium]|nr:LysM peptidoglycan-binding domain-containing protein [Bacteroidia bacterium]